MRFLRLISGLTLAFTLQAQAAIPVEQYTQYLPTGTSLAFLAEKVGSQEPLVNYHGEQMALPASTMKIFTALSALLELGKDFRFQTMFETSGKISNGTLQGDLVARFAGDPSFTRQDLRAMVSSLKKQGITHIDGNLVIDTSVFASHDAAPGWPWNDLTQCFDAPPGAAIIDKNCFSVALYSADTPGKNAYIRIASYYPAHMFSEVRTIAPDSGEGQYCELDVVPGELNRYTLTGCLRKRADPLPLAFAVQNGAAWAGEILRDELHQADIDYSGHLLRRTQPTPPATLLASHDSAPLHDLLHHMLKVSDNMYADTIFRTIGHHYFNVPGTYRAGSDAVRRILREKAGIDLGNTVQMDGSGLSRHDLVSPATMMQALQYIGKNDSTLDFISMLPLSGHDGTLQYRGGLHEAGVDGKLSAKTGSLQGVYNLAGFLTTASGTRVAFVQYLSGYAVPPQDQRTRRAPLVRFESRLYRDLYQQY
ncbi:serine-type D-Ala-D-Ala carboxypeptidase [Tatumella terrea]|uniref:serine-type D-Ala-D-Ala carboxypeptidase n=1 Tax=Tatumella terrea TaxID=419007 RepID=UPI0031D0BCAF